MALQEILSLTPGEFEHYVAGMLNAEGMRVRVCGGQSDEGIDIEGTDEKGRPIVIQCKRYAPRNKVGSPELRMFLGSASLRPQGRALLVTTSSFTDQAISQAKRSHVEMIDGSALASRVARQSV
jgi:restriction system protein